MRGQQWKRERDAGVRPGQYAPSVAVVRGGGFVAVWESNGQDGSQTGVFGQRFDSLGQPVGPEFACNVYRPSYQSRPAVAARPDGKFVVVWDCLTQMGTAGASTRPCSARTEPGRCPVAGDPEPGTVEARDAADERGGR